MVLKQLTDTSKTNIAPNTFLVLKNKEPIRFSCAFSEEGKNIDEWRRANTEKIFSLMQQHKAASGILFAVNVVINDILTSKKGGFITLQKLSADLYIPNGGSLTYISFDSENDFVTIHLKGSETKLFNPQAQDEREIKLPLSELVRYGLSSNGVEKLDWDSLPKELFDYPLYALFYLAVKEVPEQASRITEAIFETTGIAFADRTGQVALIRVPIDEIPFTPKESELLDIAKKAHNYMSKHYNNFDTPEKMDALHKCQNLEHKLDNFLHLKRKPSHWAERVVSLANDAASSVLGVLIPKMREAKKLMERLRSAECNLMDFTSEAQDRLIMAKIELKNMSDNEIDLHLSKIQKAVAVLDKVDADILEFGKRLPDSRLDKNWDYPDDIIL